jgi:hypothetical protein
MEKGSKGFIERMESLERIAAAKDARQNAQTEQALQGAYDAYRDLTRGTMLAQEIHELAVVREKAEGAGLLGQIPENARPSIIQQNGISGVRIDPGYIFDNGEVWGSEESLLFTSADRNSLDWFQRTCAARGITTVHEYRALERKLSSMQEEWQGIQEHFYTALDNAIEQALPEGEIGGGGDREIPSLEEEPDEEMEPGIHIADRRFEALKARLFQEGPDAIELFLDHNYDAKLDDRTIEREMNDVYFQMLDVELEEFYRRYNIPERDEGIER